MATAIDDYVASLDRRLIGPRRVKRDMITEARDSLRDAAEAYREAGLDEAVAERRAVDDFGSIQRIAPGYQGELAASSARRLAVAVAVLPVVAMLFGDRMWQDSPWDGIAQPSGGYALLARSLDMTAYVWAIGAVLAFVALRWQARRGTDPRRLVRTLGMGTIGVLGVVQALGATIYVSTVVAFPVALTWPPMIAGGLVLTAIFAGICWAAVRCLRATAIAPARVGGPRPENC
jgi:hypothetical protein